MTQYTDRVEYQKMLFAAEDWAKQVSFVHAHSLTSMHYAEGRNDGSVMDIGYNSGVIKREIRSTGEVVWFGKRLKGEALVDEFRRRS
jgi:hypothetical protein